MLGFTVLGAHGFDWSVVKSDNRFPLCSVYHMEKLTLEVTAEQEAEPTDPPRLWAWNFLFKGDQPAGKIMSEEPGGNTQMDFLYPSPPEILIKIFLHLIYLNLGRSWFSWFSLALCLNPLPFFWKGGVDCHGLLCSWSQHFST